MCAEESRVQGESRGSVSLQGNVFPEVNLLV